MMNPCGFVFLILCTAALAAPRAPRQQQQQDTNNAQVLKITEGASPIITDPLETPSLEPRSNTSAASTGSAEPTPVPPSQAITTEQLPPNSPSLVPAVVEISTQDAQNTPAPTGQPGNSTEPVEEEDEESDEESEEEADEEDEDEDEDEEDDNEEEEDEEEDDLSNVVLRRRKARGVVGNNEEVAGSFQEHKVQLGSVVVVDEDKISNEEGDELQQEGQKVKLTQKDLDKLAIGGVSALQGVPARSPTNEDDEIDAAPPAGSVVLAVVKN